MSKINLLHQLMLME